MNGMRGKDPSHPSTSSAIPLRIALGVAVALAVGSGLFAWKAHADDARLRTGEERALRRRVADLERRLGRLSLTVDALGAARTTTSARTPLPFVNVSRAVDEPARSAAQQRPDPATEAAKLASYWDHVERSFQREARDAHWYVERDLEHDIVGRLGTGSQIRSLDCRTSMCRLETQHADSRAYDTFVSVGFQQSEDPSARPLWNGATLFHVLERSESGPIRTAVYFIRENYNAPAVPEDTR